MKKFAVLIMICVIMHCVGCSVYMAAKQPDEKNLDVMAVGTPRSVVLGEFGQPVTTEIKDGQKSDIFVFTQGYSKGNKTGRAVFHGLADVFTLGLWEVVGTPSEAAFDGTKVSYNIEYDNSDKVKKVTPLTQKSKDELNPQAAIATNPQEELKSAPETTKSTPQPGPALPSAQPEKISEVQAK